jgi:extradiol dioxygenase family protein
MTLRPFHLAFPVRDIAATKRFYVERLGCRVGREDARWIDFDFHGHQLSAHVTDSAEVGATNLVDGEDVPVRHFGVILTMPEWQALAARLRAAGVEFLIEPQLRFAGKAGEQATMFLLDPSGNALEFKAFADDAAIFAR